MTVTIKNVGNGAGFGGYTLINRPGARAIMGDVVLGDEICKSVDYKSGNSVNFVISFAHEDGVTQEQGRKIAKEFMQSFMHGFKEDEYHMDLVEHTDSDHLHYHGRVPKLNLLTGTQLKLYWHKTDLEYKKAVINDICHKYGLVSGEKMKNTIPNPMHKLNQINKWREEHSQEPLDLASPKLKRATEKRVSEYISQTVKAGLINSLDEVKAEVVALGLEIVNEGYDKGKEFHYLTVQNESGKMRLRGDIYGEQFYDLTREDRAERVSTNRSFTTRDAELRESGEYAKQALQRERRKRLKFIEKQYGNARKRAYQREDEASIQADRNQEQRDIGRVGTQNEEHPRNNVRDASADSQRGRGSLNDTKADDRQEQRADKGYDGEVGGSEQRESRLHMGLDNDVRSMDGRHRMGGDLSQPKPTSVKERREEDNPRGRDAGVRTELHATQDQGRLAISREARGELDDSIRAEINDSIRATAGSFYRRIETDNSIISREHERSQERDSEAEQDVGTVWEHIKELADKHKSGTAERVGEQSQREIGEFDGTVSEASRKQSAISKSYAGLERELNGAVAGVGEKAGELSQARRGFSEAVKRCISRAIEKVREVAQKVQQSYSRGSNMLR
jgi:hypothetical protein